MKQIIDYINEQIAWADDTASLDGIKREGQLYWRGYANAMRSVRYEIEKQEQS